jgi:thioredoxin 1
MPSLTLEQHNRSELLAAIGPGQWLVACLCAQWCTTCGSYRASFEQLADKFPALRFVWIDIEDQADVVGDLDVDNFPTLLIQRGDDVAFFGTVLPDLNVAERLIAAQLTLDGASLQALTAGSAERRNWQDECNLRTLLAAAAA